LFLNNGFFVLSTIQVIYEIAVAKNIAMQFSLEKSIPILERTPNLLKELLTGLDNEWIMNNEGENTWNPYDVVGHLLHGENYNWIPRISKTLTKDGDKVFEVFDRTAMFEESKGKTLADLLDEFAEARENNLQVLHDLNLTETDLDNTAIHPSLGTVTLRQLLSTWVAHDLSHIIQICRTMAKQYKEAVGPWKEYLSVMQ